MRRHVGNFPGKHKATDWEFSGVKGPVSFTLVWVAGGCACIHTYAPIRALNHPACGRYKRTEATSFRVSVDLVLKNEKCCVYGM